MFDRWKSLSEDNKVKMTIPFIVAILAGLGYLGQRWLDVPPPHNKKAVQTQSTLDNRPLVSKAEWSVTNTSKNLPQKNYDADLDLRIINVRLIPYKQFTFQNDFSDAVHIYVEVRNLGNKPIHLTSVDIEIVGKSSLKFGPGSSGFGSDPMSNKSIVLGLGESKEFLLSKGILIEGISEIFCEQFADEFIMSNGEKLEPLGVEVFFSNNIYTLERFNKTLAKKFGKNTGLKLTFYSNYRKLLAQHKILISKGVDLFNSKSGSFQHDVFIGTGLAQLFEELKSADTLRMFFLSNGNEEPYLDMKKYIQKYKKCYGKTLQAIGVNSKN